IYNKNIQSISNEALKALVNYSWPGNVRELENLIEYGVIFEKTQILSLGTISKKMISKEEPYLANKGLRELVSKYEKRIIENLIKIYGNDTEAKKKIAKHLKISQATLYRKLKEHNYQT
ncbi:MAG TPA: helix-turn-helix domain-containing protein, partial [Thermoanaerobacterales bacterium]|nr:helix-turn-helix domain-containing protein [Thermoanaerobacterales bacterium]